MAGLPHDGIVEPQIPRYRVSRALWSCLETLDGPLGWSSKGNTDGGGLDGAQLIHQGLVNAAAKLAQRLGERAVGVCGIA